MKKLIVIFMFLAVVSVATATISTQGFWNVELEADLQTVNVALYSASDATQFNLQTTSIVAGAPGVWSLNATNAGFTSTTGTNDGMGSGTTMFLAQGLVTLTDPPVAGNLWTATYTLTSAIVGEDQVIFAVDNAAYVKIANVDNAVGDFVVPEPMTMALLGLGGLFLRRRK